MHSVAFFSCMNSLSKLHHHIRHTRPKWYHHYHQWEHHSTLHWITFSLSTIVMILGFVNAVMLMQRYNVTSAQAATTNVTQTVNQGLLTINSAGSASMTPVTTSATSAQNSTGSLGTVTVTDNTGTGVGWSATATSTHFIKYNTPIRTGGAAGSLTVDNTATYNNATGGTYVITITTGGTVGNARFSVSGPESLTNQITSASGSYGARGLVLNFGAATYTTSDAWTIRIDVIPVTGFQITPGTLTTVAGSPTNVTAGSAHTFSGTADATSLISASTAGGYGMGQYSVTPSLNLSVPALTYANSYSATIVETVL